MSESDIVGNERFPPETVVFIKCLDLEPVLAPEFPQSELLNFDSFLCVFFVAGNPTDVI